MISSVLLCLVTVQVFLPMVFYGLRSQMIFLPTKAPNAAEGLLLAGSPRELQAVDIRRPDGRRLEAYRSVHEDSASRPTLLFLHGNGGNLASRAGLAATLVRELDVGLLMLDYSGYGGSEGLPSAEDAVLDGLAAYDFLISHGVEGESIVLYGESLGGAVALEVASRRKVAGVVTQSSFSSLSSMVRRIYPWMPLLGWMSRDIFPSDRLIADLVVPLLVVHGDRDRLIPPDEAHRLHRAAVLGGVGPRAALLLVPGAGHNDLFAVAGPSYMKILAELLRRWT